MQHSYEPGNLQVFDSKSMSIKAHPYYSIRGMQVTISLILILVRPYVEGIFESLNTHMKQ